MKTERDISEIVRKYGSSRIAGTSGLYDSVFPVLFCNDGLIVVDMNEAAERSVGTKLRGKDISGHFSPDDVCNIKALMKYADHGGYAVAAISKAGKARTALVVPRRFFGAGFAEIRLFRSRREMLSSYDTHELFFPIRPKTPDYPLLPDRRGNEETARELNEVFAYNMLSNLYSAACSPDNEPETVDVCETVRRIVSEVSKALDFNRLKWKVTLKQDDPFVFPIANRRNFINVIALAVMIFSKIAGKGASSVLIESRGGRASIRFFAETAPTDVTFVGDFAFSLVGEMFPEVRSAAEFLTFICGIDGIGCYSEADERGTLTLRILVSKDEIPEKYTVKHRKRFDTVGMKAAIRLLEIAESIGKDE